MSASAGREDNNKKKDLPLPALLLAALGGLGTADFFGLLWTSLAIFQVSRQKEKFQTSAEALIPLNGRKDRWSCDI